MVLTALLTVSARDVELSDLLNLGDNLGGWDVCRGHRQFRPFLSRNTSALVRDLDVKLTNQLVLSTNDVLGEREACFSRKTFFKLVLLTVFGGIEDSLGVGFNLAEYLRCVLC